MKVFPASVKATLRVVRTKSGIPKPSSTALIAWLTADALIPSSAAAAANPPRRATANTIDM
jgi:hypothetical protein